jgi:hypothetical protein
MYGVSVDTVHGAGRLCVAWRNMQITNLDPAQPVAQLQARWLLCCVGL